jgi:hypothetical protein
MVTLFRHRQPKGAATVKPHLSPPRHIPTLPLPAEAVDCRHVRFAIVSPGSRHSASGQ